MDFTYTPINNENGNDSFIYTITKNTADETESLTATATVSVVLNPINDAPVAVNDTATAEQGETITITPLANDTDIDGDTPLYKTQRPLLARLSIWK